MNIHKPKSLSRMASALVLISILTASLLTIRPIQAQAQSDNPTAPAQTQLPSQETLQAPTGLATTTSSAIPSATEPATLEPTLPTEEPAATVTQTQTLEPTSEPAFDLTASPTAEPTATATAAETAAEQAPGELSWSLVMSVPVPSAEVQAMGGAPQTSERLESTLDDKVKSKDVDVQVQSVQGFAAGSSYQVELNGSNSQDELRQVIYTDLGADFDFLGGPARVTVSTEVEQGQDVTVMLESRPGTGFGWNVQSVEPDILTLVSGPDFVEKATGPGTPAQESLRLHATQSGAVTLHLIYNRPFESGMPVTRNLTVETAQMPDALDLSSPVTPFIQGMGEVQAAAPAQPAVEANGLIGYPASFDWRSQGKVTPIRNQGACGGCWAFGTVGAMELALLIEENKSVDLSEQYLISCNTSSWGCGGGWWAHDMHTDKGGKNGNGPGAVLESDKPYTATNGSCSAVYNHPYKLSEWHYITDANSVPSVDQIKAAIYNYGPVATAVCSQGWGNYTGGVYSKDNNCLDHGVVLVGWDDATQTWILRNSWGSNWGDHGYMHIKWGVSNVGYGSTYVLYNPPAPSAPPTNDDINSAVTVASPGGITKYQDNRDVSGATLANDDPSFPWGNPQPGSATVWYRFSSFSKGTLVVHTKGSDYDTVLGVYTGTRGSLKQVAWKDDISSSTKQSKVAITTLPDTTYYIEVASKSSNAGDLSFTLSYTPIRTAFNSISSPKQLKDSGSGYEFNDLRDVYSATTYYKDPLFPLSSGNSRGYRTIWYRFYPLNNGTLTVNTTGSNYDTLLGVWEGSRSNPKVVEWDDDGGGSNTSSLTVRLAGRHYYYIEVADKNKNSANSHMLLSLKFTPDAPVGAGIYDNSSSAIVYLPDWNTSSAAGAYGGSLNLSEVVGELMAMTFIGRRVKVKYSQVPKGGYISIYIDGRLRKTLKQRARTTQADCTWTGPLLPDGTHTVKIVHRRSGEVNIDALVVE